MDIILRTFIDNTKKFVALARSHNAYDAEELYRWVRDLEQFPSIEAVPSGDWDEHYNSIVFCRVPSDAAKQLRKTLLAFVDEQRRRVATQSGSKL